MLNCNLQKNRRGQISETITWIVATIIIIFVLISSIYISSAMGKSKVVERKKIFVSDEVDWINEKNNYAYSLNGENKNKIQLWIVESDINGN